MQHKLATEAGATGAGTKGTTTDLLVLVLPKVQWLEVCRQIRRNQSLDRLPIAMLMARGSLSPQYSRAWLGKKDAWWAGSKDQH